MATYKYSDNHIVVNGVTINGFNNGATASVATAAWTSTDKFIFDGDTDAMSASALSFAQNGADVDVTFTFDGGSKTLKLTGTTLAAIGSTQFTFGDTSSKVLIGDGLASTTGDTAKDNTIKSTLSDDYINGLDNATKGDTVDYTAAIFSVTANLSAGTASGGAGTDALVAIENIKGSKYNDNLTAVATGRTVGAATNVGSRVDGGTGIDTLTGVAGDDTFVVTAGDIVDGNAGTDTVEASVDWELSPTGGADIENLTLTGNAQTGLGNSGDNTLTGNGGNNYLDGVSGAGDDDYVGSLGADTYVFNKTTDAITGETTTGGTDYVFTSITTAPVVLPANIENGRALGTGDVDLTGNSGKNTLYGNAGNNDLVGSDTDGTASVDIDTLYGYAGTDHLTGGIGNDILYGGNGTDTLDGGEGADVMIGGNGTDVLDGIDTAHVADVMNGGNGNDTFHVDLATDKAIETLNAGIDIVEADVSYVLGDNVDKLTLSDAAGAYDRALDTTFTSTTGLGIGVGNGLNNTITGNTLDNKLDGRAGIDTLIGLGGNDLYIVDSTSDKVTDSAGTDEIRSSATYTLKAGIETLTLTGSGSINGTGLAGNATETINGNDGANKLTGNDGVDNLNGGKGNDTLDGGTGDDVLSGGEGNDILDGGAHGVGSGDTLKGGLGDDTFVFTTSAEAGGDIIGVTGDLFVPGTDQIDFSAIFNGDAEYINTNAFSAPGQVRAVDGTGKVTIEVNVTGADTAEFSITLTGVTAALLASSDFIF